MNDVCHFFPFCRPNFGWAKVVDVERVLVRKNLRINQSHRCDLQIEFGSRESARLGNYGIDDGGVEDDDRLTVPRVHSTRDGVRLTQAFFREPKSIVLLSDFFPINLLVEGCWRIAQTNEFEVLEGIHSKNIGLRRKFDRPALKKACFDPSFFQVHLPTALRTSGRCPKNVWAIWF